MPVATPNIYPRHLMRPEQGPWGDGVLYITYHGPTHATGHMPNGSVAWEKRDAIPFDDRLRYTWWAEEVNGLQVMAAAYKITTAPPAQRMH